jgi:hypothetical protein
LTPPGFRAAAVLGASARPGGRGFLALGRDTEAMTAQQHAAMTSSAGRLVLVVALAAAASCGDDAERVTEQLLLRCQAAG